jgi:quercetin dioxygenase-like cupin family protein
LWGQIHVLSGSLLYTPEGLPTIKVLAGASASIPPQMLHSVSAKEDVSFYVAFYTKA